MSIVDDTSDTTDNDETRGSPEKEETRKTHLTVDGNEISEEMKTFTESLIDGLSPAKPDGSLGRGDEELDEVPIKYFSAEMEDHCTDEQDIDANSSSDINWTACRPEFIYSDLDTLENELGEIYGYYELTSLSYNFDMFHTYMEIKQMKQWSTSGLSDKHNFLHDLLDELELVDEYKRYDAVLAICYLIQGCWKDLETAAEQLQCIEDNSLVLFQCCGFSRVWCLLVSVMLQIEEDSIQGAWGINERIMENCLNILCTMSNVALRKREHPCIQGFLSELITAEGDSVLINVLENFVKFELQLSSQSFLLKKLLLLARNMILLSVGDSQELKKIKEDCRKAAGLKPSTEDTILNCRKINVLQKNSSWNDLKDQVGLMTVEELGEHARQTDQAARLLLIAGGDEGFRSLPWSPKSSIAVLRASLKDTYLYNMQPRQKIPIIMQQRVHKLIKHLHVPLSDFHLQEEELIRKYPNIFADQDKPNVERTEDLFLAFLPLLETLMNAMMRVLGDATPVSNPAQLNPKYMSANPPFVPRYGGDATYFVEDSTRQAEIIVKAISTIILMLLKHTKLNHIYQFECLASEIVSASYIPTVLRYFNRDVCRNLIQRPALQHPHCPFKAVSVELSLHEGRIEGVRNSTTELLGLSWRNTFSHINLLRILNKIVKGKPSRILMLRMFKAHYGLKRCLNVEDSLFQQYTLKLLKHLCKYLDQEWKRNNQRIISAIYHKVRHRLLEDWIGEISSKNSDKMKKRPDKPKTKKWPWDHNKEECQLHQNVILYLTRRFGVQMSDADEESFSGEMGSVCLEMELPESFKKGYERWMDLEVINKNIAWDNLLSGPYLV